MKKVYSKPNIVYEDFSPSTSIAAGCQYEADVVMYECGIEYDTDMLFILDVEACNLPVEMMSGVFDEICYHNPSPGNNVFTS